MGQKTRFLICMLTFIGGFQDLLAETNVRCKILNETDLLAIDYFPRDRKVGSIATFHCFQPAMRTGVSSTKCLQNGSWADPTPTCKNTEKSRPVQPLSLNGEEISTSPPNHRDSNVQPREQCHCTYVGAGHYVQATVGNRRLKDGDEVTKGRTVNFSCRSRGILTWKNGFRTYGNTSMTCTTCRRWEVTDNPDCKVLERGGTFIILDDSLEVQPGGAVEVEIKKPITLRCGSSHYYPQWSFRGEPAEIKEYFPGRTGYMVYYVSSIYVNEVGYENSGLYTCHFNPSSKFGHTVVDVRVKENNCPLLAENPYVTYSDGSEIGSWATFSCPENTELVGQPQIVCQNDGTWSSPEPYCREPCKIPSLLNGVIGKYVRTSYWRSSTAFKEIEVGTTVEEDEIIYIRCYVGFEVLGSREREEKITCSKGIWSSELECKPGDCQVPSILHGSLKDEILGREYFNVLKLRYERKVSFETIPVGNTVPSTKVLHLFCEDRRTFQGTDHQSVSVQCYKGRWTPVPVCLRKGGIHIPTTTVKPRLPSPTTISLRSVTISRGNYAPSEIASTKEFSLSTTLSRVSTSLATEEIATPAVTDPTNENLEDKCSVGFLWTSVKEDVVPDMSAISDEYVPFGTTVPLTCEGKYIPMGNSTAVCGEQGR